MSETTEQDLAVERALDSIGALLDRNINGGARVVLRDILTSLRATDRAEPSESQESTAVGSGDSPLVHWWVAMARDEISGMVSKMEEYGGLNRATDLTELGQALTMVGVPGGPPTEGGAVQEGWLQELGIYFYLRGKFARWGAAIKEGRPVSEDTLTDIAIYTRMVQRVRSHGGWPE